MSMKKCILFFFFQA